MEETLEAMGFHRCFFKELPKGGSSEDFYRVDGPIMFYIWKSFNEDVWCVEASHTPEGVLTYENAYERWHAAREIQQTSFTNALELQCFIMEMRDKHCSPTHGGNSHECDYESI